MNTLKIHIQQKNTSHPILIGTDLIDTLGTQYKFEHYTSVFIISDSNVAPLYLDAVTKGISKFHNIPISSYIYKAGEQNKTLKSVQEAVTELTTINADRKTLIVNLGGGIVTDMGGFIASTYLRGVDFNMDIIKMKTKT